MANPPPTPLMSKHETEKHYLFETFYHPYVCESIKQLRRYGIDGLLNPNGGEVWKPRQLISKDYFLEDYDPAVPVVEQPYPLEDVDFSHGGGYSLYNWELFFHGPLLIAERLSKNQRFEEAQKWFHYIFDPTEAKGEAPERFWKTRPFFENTDAQTTIQDLMEDLNNGDSELANQVAQWENDPFKPHLIARMRKTAYQKTVVMKYIDNLIVWGDQLLRRDTIESINEATQLYILAAEILGKRPERIAEHQRQNETFNSVKDNLDAFSNVLVEIENLLPESEAAPLSEPDGEVPPGVETLYFCIPKNDKLLGYWDTAADRLFKIRHCMNIEGVVRQLPLFEPPIDPALLVKAAAAGVDISSALNDMNAPLPHYRFNVMLQKATELCNDLKSLGAVLLSALEKKDAEALALLRSSHESKLLDAVKEVKKQQIEEATEALDGLNKSEKVIEARLDYYHNLLLAGLNPHEQAHLDKLTSANSSQKLAIESEIEAKEKSQLPNLTAGISGFSASPVATATVGGINMVVAAEAQAKRHSLKAADDTYQGTTSSIMGVFTRRTEEQIHLRNLATRELDQIAKQISTAEIRVAITEQDLKNHDLQVENAKEVDEYMRTKYTNRELYDWMVSQISAIYFQSYQMAYDIAKRAERTYRFELGLSDSSFIQFGYWDSLKKGLLAGERLHYDLKRMEIAYLDQNKREYEITKHWSLATWDPLALIVLKETGQCFVRLSEALLDMDYPGHYLRRIKSVSLTLPCVTGPYTNINCTLTLLRNSVRKNSIPQGNEGKYTRDENGEDPRFADSIGAIQSIVTSSAQNDSGLFEPNRRDERYLPFENAGAISEWRLELPKEFRQFDYDTISDVILHLRYTAREGGEMLKTAAVNALKTEFEVPLARMFSAKHEFPSEWHRFLHPGDTESPTLSMKLDLSPERFPFQFRDEEIQIDQIGLFVKLKDNVSGQELALFLTPPNEPANENDPTTLQSDPTKGDLLFGAKTYVDGKNIGDWRLGALRADMAPIADEIEDIISVCQYSVSPAS